MAAYVIATGIVTFPKQDTEPTADECERCYRVVKCPVWFQREMRIGRICRTCINRLDEASPLRDWWTPVTND